MSSLKFSTLLLATFTLMSSSAFAVKFSECEKFINTDKHKYLQCAEYSFTEAAQNREFHEINRWLSNNRGERKYFYTTLLGGLMCGTAGQGRERFKVADRQKIIRVTNDLVNLGASFNDMPSNLIVTPLFCISNRQDSVILNHALTRMKASKKDLDTCPYEGTDTAHIPLVRAVMNNDLASAKVLVKHGATPDFSVLNNETALKKALELGYVPIANWLLDVGASVHKRDDGDDGKACGGKSALDYALEIPAHIQGRNEIIERIQTLMQRTPARHNDCK
ncbi:MAG: hypothetical protein CSB47_03985 [Proteobacteria bacterium]|nr:MAG: hypothetical protein CSB47_03985 [Pseudomonadota bacterium]